MGAVERRRRHGAVVGAGCLLMGWVLGGCPAPTTSTTTGDTTTSSSSSSSGDASSGMSSSSSGVSGSSSGTSGSGSTSSSGGPGATNCEAYCTRIMGACTGEEVQYPSQEVCLAACSFFPQGMAGETSGNSLECRHYHAGVAGNGDPTSPATHCGHSGPDGEGACGTICDHYCDIVLGACTGANEVYADRNACMTACTSLPTDGAPSATTGNSVQCRAYHAAAGVASNDLATHCPHTAIDSATCLDTPIGPAMVEAASGYNSAATSDEIQLVIPPGALSGDTTITVTKAPQPADPGQPNLMASGQFTITMSPSVTLSRPMTITIPISPAPVHPQLAEIWVVDSNGNYTRIPSFYQDSEQSIIADVTQTNITLAAVIRTLQAETGMDVEAGRDVFMFETFGNEAFFSAVLGLHEVLPYVPPSEAVAMGAQVNLADVPDAIVSVLTGSDLAAKDEALDNPAITTALLRGKNGSGPGAVVGIAAVFGPEAVHECPGPDGRDECPTAVGITCALCHVTVEPTTFALTAGMTALPIGAPRFDGQPNLAMNAGGFLALSPFAQDTMGVAALLNSWGPGRFDVRALPDNPLEDGVNNPTDFPPLWNFVDLEQQDYAYNWDGQFKDVAMPAGNNVLASQAEAVYDLVMHANGAFGTMQGTIPPELAYNPGVATLEALANAESGTPGNDVTEAELRQVQAFERSMVSPAPGTFDEAQALAGFRLFYGKASCSMCHVTAEFTGPGRQVITNPPPEGGLGEGIKVAPLRGISRTAPYFHNGSAPTLEAVIARYVARGGVTPMLTAQEQAQLVEYLKSL